MTFAIDLKDEGITVICYCPGWCAVCLSHCLIHFHGTSTHDGACLEAQKRGAHLSKLMGQVGGVCVLPAVLLSAWLASIMQEPGFPE